MAGLRVHFVFPPDLVRRVDAVLVEGQSRGEFVRRAVERALVDDDGGVRGRTHSSSAGSPDQRPASAEQPSEWPADREDQLAKIDGILEDAAKGFTPFGVRSSAEARRDVRPIPKKGER